MFDDLKFYAQVVLVVIAWQVICLWLAVSEVVKQGRLNYANFVAGMLGLILAIGGWWGLVSPQRFTGRGWWWGAMAVVILWIIGLGFAFSHNLPDDKVEGVEVE